MPTTTTNTAGKRPAAAADVEEEAVATAKRTKPPKKKNKPDTPPPPPPQQEKPENKGCDQAEEEEEEESEETVANRKKALSKRRRKAKLVGYRSLSRQAGYIDRSVGGKGVDDGSDCTRSLLSLSDAKRLMRFVPVTPGAIGFSTNEFKQRLTLHKSSVPGSAARETQARCDTLMRSIVNQAVLRTIENGKTTVAASTVAAVLRPYGAKLEFTAVVPPQGLVRYAQDAGILDTRDADVAARAEEKKDANANKKAFAEFAEAERKRVEANRAKRAATAASMEVVKEAAEAEVAK